MTKKRQILFSVIRGLLAILIALLVATLLIFLSADGDSFAEKLAATGGALKQLLVGPLFRMGRSGTEIRLQAPDRHLRLDDPDHLYGPVRLRDVFGQPV